MRRGCQKRPTSTDLGSSGAHLCHSNSSLLSWIWKAASATNGSEAVYIIMWCTRQRLRGHVGAFRKGKETVETEFNWSLRWLCTILYGEQICTTCLPEQLPKPIWETHGNMELVLSAVKGGDSRTLITLLMDDYQCKECVRLQLGSTYLR